MTSSLPTILASQLPAAGMGAGLKADPGSTGDETPESEVSFLALMADAAPEPVTLEIAMPPTDPEPVQTDEGADIAIENENSEILIAEGDLPMAVGAPDVKQAQGEAPVVQQEAAKIRAAELEKQRPAQTVLPQVAADVAKAASAANQPELVRALPQQIQPPTKVRSSDAAASLAVRSPEINTSHANAAQSLLQAFAQQGAGPKIPLTTEPASIAPRHIRDITVDTPLRAGSGVLSAPTPPKMVSPTPAPVAVVTDKAALSGDMVAILNEDGQIARVVQAQSGQPTTVLTSVTPTTTADAARHVAGQMAVAVTAQNGGPTELALNPPELGRVRLTLTAQDTMIVMMVQAERPETSDMMRRHLDVLSQEFRNLGYSDIQFDFGDNTGAQTGFDETADADGNVTDAATDAPTDTIETTMILTADSGLDLRL